MTEYQTVLFELVDGVATVTLHRPDVLNSFDQRMLDEFADVWRRCRLDDDVRVVVLRAAGERAFSTGVDRKAGRTRHPNPWSADDPGFFLGAKQNRVWKPLICAVHGMCAGGAFYWVNEADVVICSSDATFFDPHTTYGMAAVFEPMAMLQRMPIGEVLRMSLMGAYERMSARRAHEIGLVQEVVPGDELAEAGRWVAETIASQPPLAVQTTVRAIWYAQELGYRQAIDVGKTLIQLGTDDESLAAGQRLFAEGQRPQWRLR